MEACSIIERMRFLGKKKEDNCCFHMLSWIMSGIMHNEIFIPNWVFLMHFLGSYKFIMKEYIHIIRYRFTSIIGTKS